jgi:signal transduction histidine kinase
MPSSPPCRHGGLLGMRERVEMVGGQLHTLAHAGGGLRLYALFPLPAGAARPADMTAAALP